MRIELTPELSPEQRGRWQTFLQVAEKSHPEQDPSFAASHRANGRKVVFALGSEGDRLKAVALFSLTPHPFLPGWFSDAMAYSGPICDGLGDLLDFLSHLRAQPLFRRIGRLRITPYWLDNEGHHLAQELHGCGWRAYEAADLRETGLVDLTASEEDILNRFVKSARYEYRKAVKQGLQIEPVLTSERAAVFYESLDRHRKERGMGSLPRAGFMAAFEEVYRNRNLGAMTLVTHDGDVVGGWLCHCGWRSAHLMQVITDPTKLKKLNNLRVSPFLGLDAMIWAKARGAARLDVEGYRPDMDPADKLFRVYRYKAEFAPLHARRLAGQALILRPMLHLTGNAREILRSGAKALRAWAKRRRTKAQSVEGGEE